MLCVVIVLIAHMFWCNISCIHYYILYFFQGSGETATSIGLLEALERRVAITQGKGKKSRSVLTKIKVCF